MKRIYTKLAISTNTTISWQYQHFTYPSANIINTKLSLSRLLPILSTQRNYDKSESGTSGDVDTAATTALEEDAEEELVMEFVLLLFNKA